MDLLRGINHTGLDDDLTPQFLIDFNIPVSSKDTYPASEQRLSYIRDTFGNACNGLTEGQVDILHPLRSYAVAFIQEVMPVNKNPVKFGFRAAVSAVILNHTSSVHEVYKMERRAFRRGTDMNVKSLETYPDIYKAIETLAHAINETGARIRMEPL